MSSVLDQILEVRRRRVQQAKIRMPLAMMKRLVRDRAERRDFAAALRSVPLAVIAESKKASPSAGVIRPEYHPADIARGYEAAGAAAISVLTEEDFFQGALAHLQEVRKAGSLPILRKDFIVDEHQIYEAAAAGADAVLLIVAALSDGELRGWIQLADSLQLSALVEVHTEEETRRAVDAGARIVGVNNRNLKTLTVDLETSLRLRRLIPPECIAVSESGIKTAVDLKRLREAGFNAVLIGERFMSQPDPGKALHDLLAAAAE